MKYKTIDFGLDPEAGYYFEVRLTKDAATIWEIYDHPNIKAVIPRHIWNRIADPVKAEFNIRLKKLECRMGRWKPDTTQMDRLLGKELILLAWAIEDADENGITQALANWHGLHPEERWWLFTTTNATSNMSTFGKNRGWRKAIRIAFTDNPTEP